MSFPNPQEQKWGKAGQIMGHIFKSNTFVPSCAHSSFVIIHVLSCRSKRLMAPEEILIQF